MEKIIRQVEEWRDNGELDGASQFLQQVQHVVPPDMNINSRLIVLSKSIKKLQEQKVTRIFACTTDNEEDARPQKEIQITAEAIIIWMDYRDMPAGAIAVLSWWDDGRKTKLREMPILFDKPEGTIKMVLRRPLEGFVKGSYRVDVSMKNKIIGTTEINIVDN